MQALAKRGHRVMVVAPRYKDYPEALDTGVRASYPVFGSDQEVGYFHAYIDRVDFVFVDHSCFHHVQGSIYGGERCEIQPARPAVLPSQLRTRQLRGRYLKGRASSDAGWLMVVVKRLVIAYDEEDHESVFVVSVRKANVPTGDWLKLVKHTHTHQYLLRAESEFESVRGSVDVRAADFP